MPANGHDFEGFGSTVELATVSSPSGDERLWPRQGLLDHHPKSKWQQAWQRIKRPPAPLALAGLAASVLLVLVGAAAYHSGRHSAAVGVTGCAGLTQPAGVGDTVAPEGSISSSFEARHDWRGRSRSVEVQGGGVVSADHGRCSDIGADVLRDSGNAVDAAVATSLCQGIFNAMASGAGGGHFMLIRLPNGTAECIDAREVAPAAANETMFVGHPDDSINGGLAIAVPLELQGLWLAHSRHGRLPWKRLFQPTIALAKNGFPAHPYLVATLSGANQTAALVRWPDIRDTFLIKEGSRWRSPRVNETCCKRPKLAALLTAVADEGPQVLYTGRFAQPLADDIKAAGGIITAADLAAAVAEVRTPIRQRVWGVDWIAAPPPSSAVTVLAALAILAGFEQPLAGGGSLGVHRTVEALKHAFALRMNLGDPGPDPQAPFVNLTDILAALHDPALLDSLRSAIKDDGVLPLNQYGGPFNISAAGLHPEDHGTSHLNVVDRESMAVSMTTTVNTGFGSKVVSASTGLLLNNQMDDFSTPGRPNVYGISPSRANFIRPGKKPFSSMSPLIAERGGKLLLAVGASGGPRIISAVLQAAVRLLAYGEDLFSAVANPRLHHQLAPESLYVEDWNTTAVGFHYNAAMAQLLDARGHQVVSTLWGAITQAVYSDPDTGALHAVSDPRKDGAPAAA